MTEYKKQTFVVFRMDDYSAISDTGLELSILELFQEKKIGVTFGVVPFVCVGNDKDPSPQDFIPLPHEKGGLLKKYISSGFLDIALHGYRHQTNNSKEPSEFAGLDYETQIKRLTEGKQFLEEMTGNQVECFVPPWNNYDENTLRALEESRFKILSAGWKGAVAKNLKLRFLPATCGLGNIREAIDSVKHSPDLQPVIVVLFHAYDFFETKDSRGIMSIQGFSDLLDWLISRRDLQLISIRQANNIIDDLTSHRFLVLEHWRCFERFLPRMFHETKPVFLYHETVVFKRILIGVFVFYPFIFVLFAALAFFITSVLVLQSLPLAKIFLALSLIISSCVLLYVLRNLKLSLESLVATFSGIGFCVGVLLRMYFLDL